MVTRTSRPIVVALVNDLTVKQKAGIPILVTASLLFRDKYSKSKNLPECLR